MIAGMAAVRISEAETIRDIAECWRAPIWGEEIIIEKDAASAVVLRKAVPPRRSISESIALADARTKELGRKPVMDAGFAADLEDMIRNRKPRDTSAWE